jgi:predicted permease
MWKRCRSLLRVLTRREDFENGMGEELRFHVEEYAADLKRSGLSSEEAHRRARMELGGLNSIKGNCREARGLSVFDELTRELRYALRLLRKSPGFTATALLTLAICLGANLTMFAAIDSILLRPLPFPHEDRLVTIFNTYPKAGVERDGASFTNYYERRGRIAAFSSLSLYRYGTAIIGDPGSTNREEIMRVSPDFFATLGRGPVVGRSFTEQETTYQTDNAAILTDAYWRQHFNADPRTLGRQIRVDGVSKTVVGILPPGFRFLSSQARLYFPLASSPEQRAPRQRHSGGNVVQMIARLKPGASLPVAQSQIDAQNATLEMDDPQAKMMADAGFRSVVTPLRADHVAAIRPTLLLMQAGVLVLLLIGTVNLVNLLLIRASGRMKELAVRQALGASRRHVVSEVLVETTLLTLMGGLLGLAVGAGGIRLLAALGADRLPMGAQISFDARMAFVALAGAVVLGVLLAAPLAWFNLSGHLTNGLQSESRGSTTNRAGQRIRHSFIAAQIALAVVLLSGTGLLGLSLKRAMEISPGFRPSRVLTGQLSLPAKNYPDGPATLSFVERLVDETSHRPGVTAAGVVTNVPFSGNSGKSAAKVKGYAPKPGESPRGHYSYGVDGDYFSAMGFSLLEGRFLTAADSRRATRVCVVDADFARYYWPHASALGGQLFDGSEEGKPAEAYTVVGVVGSVKQAGLTGEEAQGAVYYPYAFHGSNNIFVVLRTNIPEESFGPVLQRLVRQMDPDLPVTDVRPMETRIADSLVARRSPALLASLFSAIAVLLTAIGSYGVLSYAVAQRRREIGVRMALGALPLDVQWMVLAHGLRITAVGIAVGLLLSAATARLLRGFLYGMSPFDPIAFAAASLAWIAIAILASWYPARRATRVDPMTALNYE